MREIIFNYYEQKKKKTDLYESDQVQINSINRGKTDVNLVGWLFLV